LADAYGRRHSFLVACCIISIFGFLSAFSPSYSILVIFRTIVGFGVGGGSVPFDLLAEFLPKSFRGSYLIRIQYAWTIGTLFILLIAFFTLPAGDNDSSSNNNYWMLTGWRLLTLVAAFPIILASVTCYYYLPESPRWLLVKNRQTEAEQIVRKAAQECRVNFDDITMSTYSNIPSDKHLYDDSNPPPPLSTIQHQWQKQKQQLHNDFTKITLTTASAQTPIPTVHTHHIYDLFRTWKSCRITLSLWTIWFIFGFTYYGIVLFVYRRFTDHTNLHSNTGNDTNESESLDRCGDIQYLSVVFNSLSEIAGVALCSVLIDRIGRIHTQIMFFVSSGFAVVAMGSNIPYNLLLFSR
jgi:MFS family permease